MLTLYGQAKSPEHQEEAHTSTCFESADFQILML